MIAVNDLSFAYGSRAVLRGVSFRLHRGELTALLGRNGAGKTTLLRCMLGLEMHYTGSIALDGRDLRALSTAMRARLIAYIPQSHYPAFNYTALDMVLMGTTRQVGAFRAPGAEEMRIAMDALAELGISELAERGYTRLSGGEQQLVLIARALAQRAEILLMDEPTANLDFGNRWRVVARARALADRGYTVLLSTHDPEHALRRADRVLALDGGGLVADGAPEAVLDAALIRRLYGVTARLYDTPDGRAVVATEV